MADFYVKNTGSNTAPYDTWAKAATTLATAATAAAAGDTIFVSQAHNATGLAEQTITIAGTLANPVRILCANDSATPPTSLATTAQETTNNGTAYAFAGNPGAVYVYGVIFKTGVSGIGNAILTLQSSVGTVSQFESCKFILGNNGSTNAIEAKALNSTVSSVSNFLNCVFDLGPDSSGGLTLAPLTTIQGGSALGASLASSGAFFTAYQAGRPTIANIADFDFSSLPSNFNVILPVAGPIKVTLSNCKMPASWSGSLVLGTVANGQRVSMYNCDGADTNYRLQIADYAGIIRDETTIVRTGGASDGATPVSWKMVTNASANEITSPLLTDPIAIWNDVTGSSKTVTIEIITDNVTLTDAECWVDVDYLGTSGFPLGLSISDKRATVLTTAANQTSSSEAWTTTGLATPVKQKLSVTFTPQEKGYIYATVQLAKASTTVYVDPKITVT